MEQFEVQRLKVMWVFLKRLRKELWTQSDKLDFSNSALSPLTASIWSSEIQHSETDTNEFPDPIMINVHAPNSCFICGSQGSGESYTVTCLLEKILIPDDRFGRLQQPVAGLVFHYDSDSSGTIAETIYLASRGVTVKVLVSSSNFEAT